MWPRYLRGLGVLLIVICLARPDFVHAQVSLPAHQPTAEEVRVEAMLRRPVTVSFKKMTIQALAQLVATKFSIAVHIDRRALDDVGITQDAEIPAFEAMRMRLGSVLDRMLDQVDLAWLLRDGQLLITTPEEAENELETRIYPVGDLVLVHHATWRGARGEVVEMKDFDTLVEVITSTIAPDSWSDVGGYGSIEPFPESSLLVISQDRNVHGQIEELLGALRRGARIQVARPARSSSGNVRARRHHVARSGPRARGRRPLR